MKISRISRSSKIIKATLREQAQAEKAYLGNFWADVSSTVMFVIVVLTFMDLLFRRAGSIAGYTKNDYLFMFLIGEFTFFTAAHFLAGPMMLIRDSVRNGYFDLILLKPVPTRIYIYTRSIKPLYIIMTALPNFALFFYIINWSEIHLTALSIIGGIVVWVSGLIVFNTLIFALTLPVFIHGESSDMLNTWYSTLAMNQMPYEKLPAILKILSLTILPSVLMTAGTAFVMLSKGNSAPVIITALVGAIISLFALKYLWRFALNNYTSASS